MFLFFSVCPFIPLVQSFDFSYFGLGRPYQHPTHKYYRPPAIINTTLSTTTTNTTPLPPRSLLLLPTTTTTQAITFIYATKTIILIHMWHFHKTDWNVCFSQYLSNTLGQDSHSPSPNISRSIHFPRLIWLVFSPDEWTRYGCFGNILVVGPTLLYLPISKSDASCNMPQVVIR